MNQKVLVFLINSHILSIFVSTTVTQITAYLIIILSAFDVITKKLYKNIKLTTPSIFLLFLLLSLLLSSFINSKTLVDSLINSRKFIFIPFILSLGYALKYHSLNIKFIYKFVIPLFLIQIIVVILQKYGFDFIVNFKNLIRSYPRQDAIDTRKITGFLNNVNTFIYTFIPLIFINIIATFKAKSLKTMCIFFIFSLLGTSIVIFSFSSGSVLAFLPPIFILFLFNIKDKNLFKKSLKLIIPLFSISIFLFLWSNHPLKYEFNLKKTNKTSGLSRLLTWKKHLSLIKESPFWGAGKNTQIKIKFKLYKQNKKLTILHAHNNLLQMASSYGLITLCIYIIFNIYFLLSTLYIIRLKEIKKTYHVLAIFSLLTQLSIHFGGMVDSTIYITPTLYIFSSSIALVVFLTKKLNIKFSDSFSIFFNK